ncbi:MAG TPA: hypothetical protein VIV55_13340 [Flavobacterium sp.]
MGITPTIEKYLSGITNDEYHRYKSWDNCHRAFNISSQAEIHILELAFYLASWGMYRGSSGLLQKNHLIHKGTVNILFSKESQKIKCDHKNEVTRNNAKEMKMKHTIFNDNSINELFDFIDKNKTELETAQKLVSSKTNKHYPIMKIVDMYFWQIGYDKEVKYKKQNLSL